MPKDRVTNLHQNYGFVEFLAEEDADVRRSHPASYYLRLLNFFIFISISCSLYLYLYMDVAVRHQGHGHDQAVWETDPCQQGVVADEKSRHWRQYFCRQLGSSR